jgi:zinc protease
MEEIMTRGFTVVAFALFAALAAAAAAGALDTPYEGKLANGMRVILIPNPSMPMFASTVVVDAGVVYEPPELSGVTHMLEHMLFNGTGKRTQKQLYDEVDLLGAYNNAFTRETYTGYLFVVPKEGMAESLDIQSDMILHSILPPEKLDKEKGIVIEEIGKDRQSPMNAVNDLFRQALFYGTPLERPVLGTVDSVKSFTRESVLRYYQDRYKPGSMTLLCMGDFDKDRLLSLAEKTFGAAPEGAGTAAPVVKINWPKVPRLNLKKMPGRTTFLQMAFPAPPSTSEDFLPFIVLARLLDSGYKTGLKDKLNGPGGGMPRILHASVSYAYHPDHPYLEVFLMMPGVVDPEALARDVGNYIGSVAVTAPDPEEVKTVLTGLKAEDYSLEERLYMYGIVKAELLADAPKDLFLEHTAMLARVRPADIAQAARKYLASPTFVAVAMGPNCADGVSKEIPLAKETPAAPVTEEKKPAPQQTRVERAVLSNGMTAVLAETPGSRIFAVHVLAKNRSAAEPEGKAGIADLLHRLLEKGASDNLDEAALTKKLAEMGATLQVTDNPFIPFDDYYFTGEYSYIRFETLGEFAEAGLGLLAHLVQKPPIRQDAVDAVREEMLGIIRRDKGKPSAVAGRLFLDKLLPGNPLSRPLLGTEESLQSITIDDLTAFHRIYFAPPNLILSVVGNAPVDDLKKWAETSFGKIPDERGTKAGIPPAPMPKSPARKGDKPEKAEEAVGKEQSSIFIGSVLGWKPEDLPALTAMNEILSERLAFDLREKQGLAYSIGAALHIAGGGQTPWGWLAASMGTSPANIDKSAAGILKEMGNLGAAAPDEMELRKAVAEYVGKILRRRLPSVGYAYILGLEEFLGMPPGYQMQLLDAMKRLKPEDVQKAAKKYVHTDAMVEAIAK